MRPDNVVPLGQYLSWPVIDRRLLRRGDFPFQGIDPFIDAGPTMKSGIRSCPTNEVQHGLITHQRFSRPVFADVTEHVMFNPIPLRRPRRIVRYTDDDPKLVRQSLQFYLPRPV